MLIQLDIHGQTERDRQGESEKIDREMDRQRQREKDWGTWPAQSVECATLDHGVVNSSPTLGIEITKKITS